jgi:hypothetical protein
MLYPCYSPLGTAELILPLVGKMQWVGPTVQVACVEMYHHCILYTTVRRKQK